MAEANNRGAAERWSVRTLPEQIADNLGASIARGEYPAGSWLREQEIAAQYGVSRGPVREALRMLSERGLATIHPRRGAEVVEITIDSIVDLFNIRAVMSGLAARYFAVLASDDARGKFSLAVDHIIELSEDEGTDPATFLTATSHASMLIAKNCGSDALGKLITHQNVYSAWRALWQSGRLDFLTHERRRSGAADYAALRDAIVQRDDERAEAVMRRMVTLSREGAVAALVAARRQDFDQRRLLAADTSSSVVSADKGDGRGPATAGATGGVA